MAGENSGLWNWIGQNSKELQSIGSLVSGVGGLYGTWQKGKAMDRITNFNMQMYKDEERRQKKNSEAFNLAFAGGGQ